MPSPEPAVGSPVRAVVVNYRAGELIGTCVDSLVEGGVAAVVVVDNGSGDTSAAVVAAAARRWAGRAEIRWVPLGTNLGYGRAANLGASLSADGHLLVCNPDVVVAPGAVATLAGALERDPRLGAVAPLLRNPDGSVYPSARTFPDLVDAIGHGLLGLVAPRNRFTRRYRLLDWDHAEATRVDWVSGACFLARRDAWDRVGGFDPAYFMYLEDVDLCWRLGLDGWGVGYEPSAEATHVQGVSTAHHPYRMLAAHHRSMWRFASRSTTGARRLALPVVAAGLAGRLALACADHRLGSTRSRQAARVA